MLEDTVEYRIYYRLAGEHDNGVQYRTHSFPEEYIASNYAKFQEYDGVYDVKVIKETIIREVIQPTLIH